ncbi:MAG: hypothetical protein JW912_05810 [Sedimentisphaerales bacterium]|nr:hypothetical protein [Sedimentisphaerales bacterium]
MTENNNLLEKQHIPYWHTAVLWVGMLLLAFHACTHIVAAGDTWVALACGRHFYNHGVDTVEPFSFNSHKAGPTAETMKFYSKQLIQSTNGKKGLTVPIKRWWAKKAGDYENWPDWVKSFSEWMHPTGWINQNWGTHLTYYTLAKTFGSEGQYNYNMLIVWKFIVTFLSLICIYKLGRVIGANRYLSAISASFAMFVGRTFIDVRPAVFSNLLVPLFVLILALTVYRNIRYIWLLVPLMVFWCNVHGGYIYIFIMLAPFIGLNLLISIPNQRFVSLGFKGTCHVIYASIAAFIASIILNPFHLTNLTHTSIIMFSKHAASWKNVHEWHSAFEWDNKVGTGKPFLVMFIIALVVLVLWFIARFFKPKTPGKLRRQVKKTKTEGFEWPKIDLAILAIVVLTVYMAVRSRRFIPLAASVACPLTALYIEQAFKMISAGSRFRKDQKLIPAALPAMFVNLTVITITGLIIIFGIMWSLRFKLVYLDRWADDDKRTSIFMRMTASYMKPFEVCQFINDNKLSGHMFNHWTEGGAVAFGQNPDPETGHIPLKLFMDGRAQAAYDHKTYKLWAEIKRGGPTVTRAELARRELTTTDYKEIGEWIDQKLKDYDVWVVLMPSTQVYDPRYNCFTRGLSSTNNWRIAYLDNSQYLYIDTDTSKGKELISKVINQQAIYPDEFSEFLSIGYNLLFLADEKASLKGFEYIVKALEIDPSETSMRMLIASLKRKHLRSEAYSQMEKFLTDFTSNKSSYEKKSGYLKRLMAARLAANYLSARYKRANPEKSRSYTALDAEYVKEFREIYEKAKW